MPPARKINKEDIVKASINIIKNKGIQNVNARRIAKDLHCSTQPIFSHFKSMEAIKEESLNTIKKKFEEEMFKSNYDKLVYKDIGRNYINFAKNNPTFFNLLFNNNENRINFIELTETNKKIYEILLHQTGLSKEKAKDFHFRMWLYVNGIANLVANTPFIFNEKEIEELLREQYISMLLYEIKKGNIKDEVLEKTIKIN